MLIFPDKLGLKEKLSKDFCTFQSHLLFSVFFLLILQKTRKARAIRESQKKKRFDK